MGKRSALYFENPAKLGTWGWMLEDADRQLRYFDRVLADPGASTEEKEITATTRARCIEARAGFQRMVDLRGYDAPISSKP
jgi:hypothetical protein